MAEAPWHELEPRLGKAWVISEDLKIPFGTEVRVTALSDGAMVALIEWGKDRSRRVFSHALDFGMEFETRQGRRIPEWDLRVRTWLELAIADIRGKGTRVLSSGVSHEWRAHMARRFELVRRRNGWERRREKR